mgnify:CR=1 FL=1
MSARRVEADTVDLSRAGRLVHDARSSGRNVLITAYIEGLVGDPDRYAIESSIICRTQEQAAEVARILGCDPHKLTDAASPGACPTCGQRRTE